MRVLVWHKDNAIPSGSRVANQWEPVLAHISEGRSGRTPGNAVSDVLSAGTSHRHNCVGSKPPTLRRTGDSTSLGTKPATRCTALFAGSGAVTLALELYAPPETRRRAACAAPIQQRDSGRPRRTCSDAWWGRRARRRESSRGRDRLPSHPPRATPRVPVGSSSTRGHRDGQWGRPRTERSRSGPPGERGRLGDERTSAFRKPQIEAGVLRRFSTCTQVAGVRT